MACTRAAGAAATACGSPHLTFAAVGCQCADCQRSAESAQEVTRAFGAPAHVSKSLSRSRADSRAFSNRSDSPPRAVVHKPSDRVIHRRGASRADSRPNEMRTHARPTTRHVPSDPVLKPSTDKHDNRVMEFAPPRHSSSSERPPPATESPTLSPPIDDPRRLEFSPTGQGGSY